MNLVVPVIDINQKWKISTLSEVGGTDRWGIACRSADPSRGGEHSIDLLQQPVVPNRYWAD